MTVPSIVGLKPTGSQVLVEVLTSQELMGTILEVTERIDPKVPLQGYIRAVGPTFQEETWGYKVGDRVLISGSGVLAPKYDNSSRERFFMDPHSIKSVLEES